MRIGYLRGEPAKFFGFEFAVVLLCLVGLVGPLRPFLQIDLDSIKYLESGVAEKATWAFSKWGVYRMGAIVIKSVIYSVPGMDQVWLPVQIATAVLAKVVFVTSACRALAIDRRSMILLLAASMGQVFWLSSCLMLSRALNELLAALIAAAFLRLTTRRNLDGPRLALMTMLFGLVSLVTYESYALYAVIVLVVTRLRQAAWIVLGGLMSAAIAVTLQVEGTFLRSPKIVAGSAGVASNWNGFDSYSASKMQQFVSTMSRVSVADVAAGLAAGIAMLVLVRGAGRYLAVGGREGATTESQPLCGLCLGLLGLLPPFLLLSVTPHGVGDSRLEWLLLGNSSWLMVAGAVIIGRRSGVVRAFLPATVAVIFGFSVLLAFQYRKALASDDVQFVQRSVFRSLLLAKSPSNVYPVR